MSRIVDRRMVVAVILLGFCLYIIQLFVTGKISLYIHPRYSLFAVVMCSIAILLLVLGLVLQLKRQPAAIHTHEVPGRRYKGIVVNVIVVAVLALAFLLPPQPLSPVAIGARSMKTPYTESYLQQKTEGCPDSDSTQSIADWVYELSGYSLDCFDGMPIELTGFVLMAYDRPLSTDKYYLGRMIISCCAIDSQPYALPIQKKDGASYPENTWLTVRGTVRIVPGSSDEPIVIIPDSVREIPAPENPYDYLGQ